MTSKAFTQLLNHGPATPEELGRTSFNPSEKRDGLATFRPRARHEGSTKQGGGQTTPVYYIIGKHDPTTVIKRWCEANQKTIDAVGNRAVHHRIAKYGEEWKKASREIFGPFESNHPDGGDGGYGRECRICGEEYSCQFPDHVPECEGL